MHQPRRAGRGTYLVVKVTGRFRGTVDDLYVLYVLGFKIELTAVAAADI